jgi:hypothetical protein
MSQLFISHSAEDKEVAVAIADALVQRGFGVWYYERHTLPGAHFAEQIAPAIRKCEAIILIVSPVSLYSYNVNGEVRIGFNTQKAFVPVLSGITHDEIQTQSVANDESEAGTKRGWAGAVAAATLVATSIMIPPEGVSAIIDLLEDGVKMLGVTPARALKPDSPLLADAPARHAEPAPPAQAPPAAPREDVECTLFAPAKVTAGNAYIIQVWLHRPEQLSEVTRKAQVVRADAERRGTKEIPDGLALGNRLRFSLEAGRFAVESLYGMEMAWDGNPVVAHFMVEIPDGRASRIAARVILILEDVPVASLRFMLSVEAETPSAQAPAPAAQTFTPYRKAYVSYASEDRLAVLTRVQALRVAGISVSMDLLSIEPGERWEKELFRLIDEADVFYLFWSEAAARSEWVEREVRYALERKQQSADGRPEIVPVVMSVPPPPPPDYLSDIHFNDPLLYFIGAEDDAKEK